MLASSPLDLPPACFWLSATPIGQSGSHGPQSADRVSAARQQQINGSHPRHEGLITLRIDGMSELLLFELHTRCLKLLSIQIVCCSRSGDVLRGSNHAANI